MSWDDLRLQEVDTELSRAEDAHSRGAYEEAVGWLIVAFRTYVNGMQDATKDQ